MEAQAQQLWAESGSFEAIERPQPFASLDGGDDGAVSEDLKIAGIYLHVIFGEAESRQANLYWAGLPDISEVDYNRMQEGAIDRLADEMEATSDIDRIVSFLG